MKTTTQGGARTLERGLAVLEALAEKERPMGVTELATHLDLDKSTVHRLLTTLVNLGYSRRDPRTRDYTLGVKVLVLYDAFHAQIGLQRICRPLLEELTDITGETSHLAVLSGLDIVFVDYVASRQMVGVRTVVGRSEPAHCTALGKAMLAAMPEAQRAEMLDGASFEAYTDRTPTTRNAIEQDLQVTAERGWALDNEEFLLGVRCLSSAILDRNGNPAAAVGISGPAARMSLERCRELGPVILEVAQRASALLGYVT